MLRVNNTSLVIVDVQGKLAQSMHNKEELFLNLLRITKGARVLGIPIIWNEQLPDKLGPTIPEIKEVLSDMQPIVKNTFSCCDNASFMQKLRQSNCSNILLTGIETHVCVYQTARDLIEKDYVVHLIADATSSRTEINYRIGLGAIRDCGALITTVEMALFEILKVAEGDKFKEIIKIIK
ncbi:MAG: hydrolase [candidate division Zixibacteria bacterium CG_4_9_14_3_um_filter_46_8]|nr:MAG: hydrolase [candidate division Zixibacteria bacterium CG_4_9_14_3_um_filter_46_8]